MIRRFLMDNDGSNFFQGTMTEDIQASIAEAVWECPANVTTYLLCSGAGTYYYPTKVGDVVPNAPLLHAAHKKGLDPFGMFLEALKRAGKETFITYRMNDVHNPTEDWNLPRVRREHPDCIVDIGAVEANRAEWMSYCMDYSRPEVREYVLATFRELVELYDVDGIQLDWMRFPRHLSGSPEQVWEKRHFLTEFTSQVRSIIRRSGKRILLTARVPTSAAGRRHVGLDVAEWTRQGLVDFLVIHPFLTTDFVIPLQELRLELGSYPVPIYAGFDFGHGLQNHCPESLRAAALSLYDCGADGIYVFNFPCWQEHLAARPYHWLAGIEHPSTAARKPLLFSISCQHHRVPNVDLPGELPKPLPAGGGLTLSIHVPRLALPAARALFLVHSCGDIALRVNGSQVLELPTLRRSELFAEYIDPERSKDYRPRRDDCRVFQAAPSLLRAGANELVLVNRSVKDLEIKRVNLGLW